MLNTGKHQTIKDTVYLLFRLSLNHKNQGLDSDATQKNELARFTLVSPKHDTPLSALRNILKEEGEQPEVVVHIGINDIAWSILMHGEYICLYVYMSGGLSGMLFTGLYIEQGQMVTLEYNCLALSAVMIWTTFTMGFLYLFLKLVGVLKPKMTRV
ncbi:uncharacterized protein LOC144599945 isoform X4 [Rhinoraja longicauda]